mmetsp:Transcript_34980/g.68862  ORF Transcript_34980/g.68862 Transcript_34980/m.68862 type:complete len:245 (-) Transcript_34980:79-813(-)
MSLPWGVVAIAPPLPCFWWASVRQRRRLRYAMPCCAAGRGGCWVRSRWPPPPSRRADGDAAADGRTTTMSTPLLCGTLPPRSCTNVSPSWTRTTWTMRRPNVEEAPHTVTAVTATTAWSTVRTSHPLPHEHTWLSPVNNRRPAAAVPAPWPAPAPPSDRLSNTRVRCPSRLGFWAIFFHGRAEERRTLLPMRHRRRPWQKNGTLPMCCARKNRNPSQMLWPRPVPSCHRATTTRTTTVPTRSAA